MHSSVRLGSSRSTSGSVAFSTRGSVFSDVAARSRARYGGDTSLPSMLTRSRESDPSMARVSSLTPSSPTWLSVRSRCRRLGAAAISPTNATATSCGSMPASRKTAVSRASLAIAATNGDTSKSFTQRQQLKETTRRPCRARARRSTVRTVDTFGSKRSYVREMHRSLGGYASVSSMRMQRLNCSGNELRLRRSSTAFLSASDTRVPDRSMVCTTLLAAGRSSSADTQADVIRAFPATFSERRAWFARTAAIRSRKAASSMSLFERSRCSRQLFVRSSSARLRTSSAKPRPLKSRRFASSQRRRRLRRASISTALTPPPLLLPFLAPMASSVGSREASAATTSTSATAGSPPLIFAAFLPQ
eukprot:Rhum_TRINITY_DN2794_c0_g1::Rhum_TRINITY_DN2794_c0_g1_i1::g.8331::m.8331